jgi:hypothetical protein
MKTALNTLIAILLWLAASAKASEPLKAVLNCKFENSGQEFRLRLFNSYATADSFETPMKLKYTQDAILISVSDKHYLYVDRFSLKFLSITEEIAKRDPSVDYIPGGQCSQLTAQF